MMQEDSNGDFEIVDKKMTSLLVSDASYTPSSSSVLTNVAPPAGLPSFLTSPLPSTTGPSLVGPPVPSPTSGPIPPPGTTPTRPPSGAPIPHPGSTLVPPPGSIPICPPNSTLISPSGSTPIPPPVSSPLPPGSSMRPGVPYSALSATPVSMGPPPNQGPSPLPPATPSTSPPPGHPRSPAVSGPTPTPQASIISQPPTPSPVTSQPQPPVSGGSVDTCASVDLGSPGVEGSPGRGWFGWIRGTVSNVGHRVAERAKTSMDTMITTLDPQMKEFIHSGGDVDLIVASDKEVKVGAVREAFQLVFGKATVSGVAAQAEGVAAQPVGFEASLRSAEERINFLRSSGRIHPQQPIVVVENFIVELTPDSWFDMGLLLLDDPGEDILLQTYTQVTPVPPHFVDQARSSTPDDYPFKSTGFATTVGQVASQHLQVHHTLWQETLAGVPRREMVVLAARSLAGLYKARLSRHH